MANEEVLKILKQYASRVISSGIPLNKVFLYGSFSKGNPGKDSDIDVMLVSPAFDDNFEENAVKAWTISWEIDSRIEPYAVGLKKFENDDISPLLQMIKAEGVEIAL